MQLPDISNKPIGYSTRCDCTSCGSHNSVSLTRTVDGVLYYCFDASCGKKGFIPCDITQDTVKQYLNNTKSSIDKWEIPSHFIPGYKSISTQNWLTENNAAYAYKSGAAKVMYDPQQNRHVFLVDEYGGTGRKSGWKRGDSDSKWYKYGNPQAPLIVGKNKQIGVIVEDPLSACAVYPIYVGISLLGTNFKSSFIEPIRGLGLTTIIVALDKDASKKALTMAEELSWYFNDVKVKFLDKDLKYYNQEQVREILG